MAITIRPARADDAAFLLPLVNAAGGGLPLHFWTGAAGPGQDPWQVGLSRIAGDTAAFSWRKAVVAELDGTPAGCLYAHALPDRPPPPDPGLPPMFVPLQQLEDMACGTGHVHAIATAPDHRGRGVGAALMTHAGRWRGPRGMSLIVADDNAAALALYARHGYALQARRAMVKDGWTGTGRDWLLMRG
ncbi:GNAT family N-acetyltransferase [Paracoccus luteus]|uniref:GNAT family N-acetyltransferase n=1 Tax=Paracoccus luteus TaxID=2508543 RepID=UPI00142F46C6|nr:GNAT family N-acetyltransferase [Paracoccus luteus]